LEHLKFGTSHFLGPTQQEIELRLTTGEKYVPAEEGETGWISSALKIEEIQ
jgi:hypothetical protein